MKTNDLFVYVCTQNKSRNGAGGKKTKRERERERETEKEREKTDIFYHLCTPPYHKILRRHSHRLIKYTTKNERKKITPMGE